MRVAIVGGGISGLSTAYYLARGGIASTIVESRPRLGGVIQTERVDGCTVEAGPDSFLSAKPAALDLIGELGLGSEVIGSNDHLRRTYVRRRGRLVPLPDGLMMMVPTRILPMLASPLVGAGTKLRMGLELFRSPKPRPADQSVAEFIREHYGREAVDYLAEPLLSGVYGGDPAELSVHSVLGRFVELAERYGSLSRGMLAERSKAARAHAEPAPLFRTLKGGLQQMTDAVAAAIAGRACVRHARVETVERTAAGFHLLIDGDWLDADRLVVATEAHCAARYLAPVDGRLAELLGAVPYSSSMTVALGFDAADFAGSLPDGFGFLVPRVERRRLVACTWVGTKFPHRAPESKLVARCFLGGWQDPAILDQSDEAVLAIVREELRDIAGVAAQPRFHRIFRWPRSMAQYTVGHAARLAEIEARAAAIPGLYLAGNAYQGIGIPDCIRMGKAAAEAIAAS
jgi:oxygen-dependent protoporphyrinogen oxidase